MAMYANWRTRVTNTLKNIFRDSSFKLRIAALLPCHRLLDFLGFRGQGRAHLDQLAVRSNEKVIFDAHADIFLRNINSGFDSKRHTGAERNFVVAWVMDVESNVVAEAVNEI